MKRALWFIVLAAFLPLLGNAYAQQGARLEEMQEAIENQVEDSEEQSNFIEAVKDYIQERNDTLDQLVALIGEASEAEQEGAWESAIASITDLPGLSDVADDLSSESALALYDQFVDEEQEWVSALSVLKTAAYRDDLVQSGVRLTTMTQLLEDKWQGFLNDDGQLDQKELKVMADIYGILATLARESDGKRQSIRNSIQIVTDLLSKVDVVSGSVPGEVANAINQALSVIAAVTKQYNGYRTAVESLRPQLQTLAGQELGLLVTFNDARKDTQLFVKENGFDIMKSRYAEAAEELDTFASVGTSGQQEDAEAFTEEVKRQLSARVDEGKEIYNKFVTKHNLKFFGPVGPDIKEELVEAKVWLAEEEKVEQLDLESFLSAWREDSRAFGNGSSITDKLKHDPRGEGL